MGVGIGWGDPYYRQPNYWSGWWGFWYPQPVCVAYVPYGFYIDRQPVFIREVTVVEEVPVEVPVYLEPESTDVEASEPDLEADAPEAAPRAEEGPPVLDAITEKYLREGSDYFAQADYKAAASAFRLAIAADPHAAPPRFAFGQALLALGDYANAAKILRSAVTQEPAILRAPGSIVGVYQHAEAFNTVMNTLKTASIKDEANADLLFLVGYQQYFSGDPQAAVTFGQLASNHPDDPMVALFAPAIEERFPELANLPIPEEK